MSLRDWHLAAAAAAAGHPLRSAPMFSPGGASAGGGSPYTSPSPTRAGSGGVPSPLRGGPSPTRPPPAGFSFTPIAQDFVQKHGARPAAPDGGIPQLMRSCTNMLKSKMGVPATPPMRASTGGAAMQQEMALEAVGPVLESVLANLTAVSRAGWRGLGWVGGYGC